uniref:Uncharacterized protein n=1 Tax=Phenylobacterium glaciei TaxID=2803784 RepID=A0A974P557_9CAUL|nr:hypothetical protein JKL49_10455 [Phenylobacterium glaciei]
MDAGQMTRAAAPAAGPKAGAAYRATLAAHSLAIGPRLAFGVTAASCSPSSVIPASPWRSPAWAR